MKRLRFIALATALAVVCLSCENDNQDTIPPQAGKNEFMLRSMVWKDLNAKTSFSYNTDGTIKMIDYVAAQISYGQTVTYEQNKIKEVLTGAGIYKHVFAYDANGRIQTMTKYIIESPERPTLQLEFTYDQYNNVSELKYFDISEAGNKLVYTNTYEFDQARRPSKITAVDKDGNKIITTILGYSSDISFDPLYFNAGDIGETYALYNYPVLSKLKQLPTGIRLSRITAGQTTVDKEVTITYSLTGRRLDKQVSKQHFPTYPQYDNQTEVDFNY